MLCLAAKPPLFWHRPTERPIDLRTSQAVYDAASLVERLAIPLTEENLRRTRSNFAYSSARRHGCYLCSF
ncbi:MAG: hypothetical protein DME42_12260 [Verrucomicrobia bacterium]|nr:MAG: hypothetical protein DME42_12260 [Verrucomicrobiota bacterium]